MRYLPVCSALVAVAAARKKWSVLDTTWATEPDRTADWYKENGEPLPEVAPHVTTVQQGKSYVVKLDCPGCPFKRSPMDGSLVDWWNEPAQDNSLLLNLTIDATERCLLLNDNSVAPLAPMPLYMEAYQTPANLSTATMANITSMHMLDHSWHISPKYGRFDLQYEHALVGTRQPGISWIQLDVTGIHILAGPNKGMAPLASEQQQMVQVMVRRQMNSGLLSIEDVQVVLRKDRAMPFKMPCGRLAIRQTLFDPSEWDYYGQFGSASRVLHLVTWNAASWFHVQGLAHMFLFGVLVLLAHRIVAWRRDRAAARDNETTHEEAGMGLLAPEHEDTLPEYDSVPMLENKEAKS